MRQRFRVGYAGCVLICLALVFGVILGFAAPVLGLFDIAHTSLTRSHAVEQIRTAEHTHPPDVQLLAAAITGPDWYAATEAAGAAGRLAESSVLSIDEQDMLLHALLTALASDGHWWRLGWDRDEPEFGQFLGEAYRAAAKFGPHSYPQLMVNLEDNSHSGREAACWIVMEIMLAQHSQSETPTDHLMAQVKHHADADSDPAVREACRQASHAQAGPLIEP